MICSKCEIDKPETDFSEDVRNKSGRRGDCKKCQRLHRKIYDTVNAGRIKKNRKAYCLINRKKAREYGKAYRLANLEKERARDKAYYLANREKEKARQKVYRSINSKKIKAYCLANVEKIKAYGKAYRLANPEKRLANKRKRKALELNCYHEPYSDAHIFERDGWICGICGQKINKRLKWPNPQSKSIDHIIALSKGGADAPINLQAAHLRCNKKKFVGNGGQLLLIG